MKKILLFICVTMMGLGIAQAQVEKGDFAVGANTLYGSYIKNIGIGARVQYTPFDHVRGEYSMNYFFQKDYTSMWDMNFNAEYLIDLFNRKLYVYPIAGISFAKTNFDSKGYQRILDDLRKEGIDITIEDKDDKAFGLNLGAGVQYSFTDHIGFSLEYRHSIMKHIDQGVIALGANYTF